LASKSANAVRVLDQQRVAGYDATVLEADSARALNEWLIKHHYVNRPDLTVWLEPYVKNRWKITAFKIAVFRVSRNRLGGAAATHILPGGSPVRWRIRRGQTGMAGADRLGRAVSR
jgi:hypothetical protein